MEILNDYSVVKAEYESQITAKKDQLMKILLKMGLFFSVTFVTIFLIYIFFNMGIMNVPIRIIFTFIFGGLIAAFLIIENAKMRSVFYRFLLPHLIEKYSKEHGGTIDYDPFIKKDKEVNPKGGLFYRGAVNTIKYRISGQIKHVPFSIDQSYIFTSSGKSTTVYLNGAYLFFGIKEPNFIQIRDKWKPQLKGVKYQRSSKDKRIFLVDKDTFDYKYLKLFNYLKTIDSSMKVYLSANSSGLHIGLEKFILKVPSKLTDNSYLNLYQKLSQLLDIKSYIKIEFSDAF